MKDFSTLFWSHRDVLPGDQQTLAESQLRDVVAKSHFHWWQPGIPILDHGRRVLIGVAAYSLYDMRLLDVADEASSQYPGSSVHTDVFSVAACSSHEDFGKYIPGLGAVFQTPVAGVWVDGDLKERQQGKRARDLILELFGLNSSVDEWIVNLDHLKGLAR